MALARAGSPSAAKIERYGCTGPADTHLAGQPYRRNTAPVLARAGASHSKPDFGRMVERATAGACLELRAHPHILRYACGYALHQQGARHPASRAG
jgi:hypothetical protein